MLEKTSTIKALYLSLYAGAIRFFNYYEVPAEGFTLLFILLVSDTILGIAKSYVLYSENDRWFSSNKLKVGVLGKVAILMCLLLFAMVLKTTIVEVGDIPVSTVLGLLIAAEFISILQNTIMIRTSKEIEEFDALTAVIRWLLYYVKKFLKRNTEYKDKGEIKEPKKDI